MKKTILIAAGWLMAVLTYAQTPEGTEYGCLYCGETAGQHKPNCIYTNPELLEQMFSDGKPKVDAAAADTFMVDFNNKEQILQFKDRNVKWCALNMWDANKDGELTVGEAEAATRLMLMYPNRKNMFMISTYDDLRFFPNLEYLDAGASRVTAIDLSHNPKLQEVNLYNLDWSKQVEVKYAPGVRMVPKTSTDPWNPAYGTGDSHIYIKESLVEMNKDVQVSKAATGKAQKAMLKPRLVVCTDIAPADVEPDDMESMVHLMAYADLFEIEALITSVGWNCDPYPMEWMQYLGRVIRAYDLDVQNLMKRSGQKKFLSLKKENGSQKIGYWPSAEYLDSRCVMGSMYGGIRSIGERNDSPGSELLIRLADEDDPRPIYVAAWGGANTLAQAIWRVKQTRSADEVSHFVNKFRLFTITDQDMDYAHRMDRARSSHMWLRKEFKDDLQFIWDEGAWQEQCELGKRNWTQHQQHIQTKGALGKEYPNYKWGVEGDTPSFLYVIPNGLNDPEDPSQAGWAGYHERGLCPDSLTTAWTSWQEPVHSISVAYKQRFYPDELNDFMARMQWADEGKGNHNPVVRINGHKGPSPLVIHAKAGKTIRLDASKTTDPDRHAFHLHWWQQPEIGTAKLTIDDARNVAVNVSIPADAAGQTLHLICEATDHGPYNLKSYQRVILVVEE